MRGLRTLKSFLNDYHSNFIDYKDIVIFVLSTPGRMHFEFQNSRPDTASKYLHGSTDEWYKNNKKFIEWWMLNIDVSIENINHDCYIHALKTFAELQPETKVILLANSDHDPSGKNKLPLGNIPNNFFWLGINFINCINKFFYSYSRSASQINWFFR